MKLPAYARRLESLRMAGHHPLWVRVLFGDDWAEAKLTAEMERVALTVVGPSFQPYGVRWRQLVGHPVLVVSPRDFAPGAMDLRCVTGSCVRLVDQSNHAQEWEGKFFTLAAEIAQRAVVDVSSQVFGELSLPIAAHAAQRVLGRRPAWWPEELERGHGERTDRWIRDCRARIAQHRAAA